MFISEKESRPLSGHLNCLRSSRKDPGLRTPWSRQITLKCFDEVSDWRTFPQKDERVYWSSWRSYGWGLRRKKKKPGLSLYFSLHVVRFYVPRVSWPLQSSGTNRCVLPRLLGTMTFLLLSTRGPLRRRQRVLFKECTWLSSFTLHISTFCI